jgi:uncharacterized protein with PQ loop repeat
MGRVAILANVVGWIAALLTATLALPQFVRIAQVKAIDGVSIRAWQAIWWSAAAWSWYGIFTGRLQLIACNFLMVLGTAAVLALISRHSTMPILQLWIVPLIGAAAAVMIWTMLGELAFALTMTVPALGSRAAQLATTVRSVDIFGLSVASLAIGALAQVLWAIYGALTQAVAIVILNVPGAVLLGLAVGVVLHRRSKAVHRV